MKRAIFGLVCATIASPAIAQDDLDVKAWNLLWDRMERVTGNQLSEAEILNLLTFPRPLAAVDAPSDLYFRQLSNIAGVIPKPDFALDVSDNDLRLHDAYYDIISKVQLSQGTPAQQKELENAAAAYSTAFKNLRTAANEWRQAINQDLQLKRDTGITVTRADYFDARDANAALVTTELQALDNAAVRWQNATLGNQLLINAVKSMKSAVDGASADTGTFGIFRYQINDPIDRTECNSPTEWTEVKLETKMNSQKTRNSGWNANGGWAGAFVKIGAAGGGSNFSNLVTSSSEYISLRFCKATYASVGAPWLNMQVLRAIHQGSLKLKPGTPAVYRKPLGPDGIIPRHVKGVLVARAIELEAKLSTATMNEIKKSAGGGGGLRIGPLRIGGGGGGSSYDITSTDQSGFVRLTSKFSDPVIFGVLLEDTEAPTN